MPFAARVGDPTGHPGIIGTGAINVLIGGRPAAVVGSLHICALPPPAGPHQQTPIAKGSSSVLIGGRPAARVGDVAGCKTPIVAGAFTVLIGN